MSDLKERGIEIQPPSVTFPDTFKYTLLAFLVYFPVTYILVYVVPHDLYSHIFILGKIGNFTIWYCFPSIAGTILYSIIFYWLWWSSFRSKNYLGLVAFLVCTLFAVCFATTIDVAFNPSASLVRWKYVFYIDYAFSFLKQASLVAVIPLVEVIAKYAYTIFKNNITYSVRCVLAGLIGGLVGFLTTGLMAVFCTGYIFGCTVGLIIRNSLLSGKSPLLTPFLSYLAALGIPPFFHTFWEYFAFGMFTAFGSFLTYSLIKRRLKLLEESISFSMLGIFMLLSASFIEVSVDCSFVKLVHNYISFTPQLTDFPLSTTWLVGLLSTIITTLFFIWIVSWLINYILWLIKTNLEV